MRKSIEAYRLFQHLESIQSDKRFAHSLRVSRKAARLGRYYNVTPEKCWLGGLMHDYAREWTRPDLEKAAKKRNRSLSSLEKEDPLLLHGWMGASLLKEKGLITDLEVLEAVEHHILGSSTVGPVAQIVYLSDFLEPGRKYHRAYYDNLHKERSLDELYKWVEQKCNSYYK